MASEKPPTVIKKYANRRLYHTGTSTYVTLDDLGRMVGIFIDEDGVFEAFLYAGGRFEVIRYPEADEASAEGINVLKQIVGTWDADGASHGFLLKNGRFTSIVYPGAAHTTANKINLFGQIVGTWSESDTSFFRGYVLTRSGFENIDYPGAIVTTSHDINNLGQIVGIFKDEAGAKHGYLRIPAERHVGHLEAEADNESDDD